MTATTTDETLSRSIMFLCMGAAAAILVVHGLTPNADSRSSSQAKASPAANLPLPDVPVNAAELVVDLSDRHVYVYKQQNLLAKYPIAIGQEGWETPTGTFRVMHLQRNPEWVHPITGEIVAAGPGNPLGDRWIGFWSDGHNEIGFHGTDQEDLIGQAVSHGCIRMYNRDIEVIYEQVALGSSVVVRP